jgi:DNA-binding NarL/FixJ family response regulator
MDRSKPTQDPRSAAALRVLIIDDHPQFRGAIREFLRYRGYDVVGEAHDAEAATARVEQLRPEVAIIDVRLGDDCGLELCRALTKAHPGLSAVLMSAQDCPFSSAELRAAGARGFLLKSNLLTVDLAQAVRGT